MELEPTVARRAGTNCTECGHAVNPNLQHYPGCSRAWGHPDNRADHADIPYRSNHPDPAARDCPGCVSADLDHGRVYAHICDDGYRDPEPPQYVRRIDI